MVLFELNYLHQIKTSFSVMVFQLLVYQIFSKTLSKWSLQSDIHHPLFIGRIHYKMSIFSMQPLLFSVPVIVVFVRWTRWSVRYGMKSKITRTTISQLLRSKSFTGERWNGKTYLLIFTLFNYYSSFLYEGYSSYTAEISILQTSIKYYEFVKYFL